LPEKLRNALCFLDIDFEIQKSPKQDVDLIVQRYKEAKELAKHET